MKILIAGSYGFGNIGDEAMLYSIATNLYKRNHNIKAFSGNIEDTKRYVPFIDYIEIKKNPLLIFNLIKGMKWADVVLVGGGSFFYDKRIHTIPFWYFVIKLAKIMNKKIVYYGGGVGPINTRLGKSLTKKAFKLFDKICVRDEASINLLKELGIKKKILISPDPLIFADIKKKKVMGGKYVVVCLRYLRDSNYNKELLNFLKNISRKRKIIFLPFCKKGDFEVAKYFENKIKNSIIYNTFSLEEINGIIYNAEFIIGERLHSLVFSAINQKKFLAIKYDQKIEEFLKQIKYEEFLLIPNKDINKKAQFLFKKLRPSSIKNIQKKIIYPFEIIK